MLRCVYIYIVYNIVYMSIGWGNELEEMQQMSLNAKVNRHYFIVQSQTNLYPVYSSLESYVHHTSTRLPTLRILVDNCLTTGE